MIKHNLFYIFIALFEKGVGFLLLPLYSAYLSPQDFGVITLITLVISIVYKFSTSPVLSALNRFYYSPDYKKEKIIFLLIIFLLIKVTFFASILFIFSDYIAKHFIDNIELVNLVNLFIIVYILSSFSQILLQLFVLEQKSKFIAKVNILKAIVLFIFTVTGLILDHGIYSVVYGLIAGQMLLLLVLLPNLKNYIQIDYKYRQLIEPLTYGYTLVPTALSNNIIQLGDRYIINIFLGMSIVGVYSFSYTLAGIISILIVAPNKMAMHPIILAKEKNKEEVHFLLKKYSIVFFSLGMILLVWFSAFSKELISLISNNDEFIAGWVIIPIIALSHLLHGLGNYLRFGIVMAKKPSIISYQTMVAALINILLNILFIYLFGMIGAAFATLISYVFLNFFEKKYSKKYYNLEFDTKKLNEIFFIGVFAIVSFYLIEYMDYMFVVKFIILLPISYLLFMRYIEYDYRIKFKQMILKNIHRNK